MTTALLVFLILIALGFGYVWYTRKVWFFRDPSHDMSKAASDELRSPVYGVVAYIKRISNGIVISDKIGEEIHITDITKTDWPVEEDAHGVASPTGDGWLIGIAMTAIDVHFQYMPTEGKVLRFEHYQTGKNLPMFDLWEYVRITWLRTFVQLWCKRYILENERQTFWIDSPKARIALILIADKFVDKITTYIKKGETLPVGAKLSFIARGSQVDVLICDQPNLEVLVSPGQPVKGPRSVLARLK